MAARPICGLLTLALLLSACSGSASAEPTRVSDVDRQGPFSLALTVERAEYEADEAIAVFATLAYGGPKASAALSGSGRGPIIFMIEQTDGPFDPGSSFTHDCVLHVLERDNPLVLALQKSGGWLSDDPRAAFWRAWHADPELRLPAGHFELTAFADLIVGRGCDGEERLDLRASVEITVR